jgi:hypothetical protein
MKMPRDVFPWFDLDSFGRQYSHLFFVLELSDADVNASNYALVQIYLLRSERHGPMPGRNRYLTAVRHSDSGLRR